MRLRNHSQLLQLGDSVGLRTKVASKWSFALDQSRVDTPFFRRPKSDRPNPGKRGTLFTSTQTRAEDGVLQAGGYQMAQAAATTLATAPSPLRGVRLVESDRDNLNDQGSGRIIVDLLGGLHLQVGASTLGPRDLGGTKPRHVLLALLLHRGAPLSKERLIWLLWGASPPSTALATLAGYVCVLRKNLEPGKAVQDSLVTTVGGSYAIDMGRVDLDLVRY